MSGLAANVSAFSAVWTREIYRSRIRPQSTGRALHSRGSGVYCSGRLHERSNLIFRFLLPRSDGVCPTDLLAFRRSLFRRISDWHLYKEGDVAWRRGRPGRWGPFGSRASRLVAARWLVYGSLMSANFYVAVYAFFHGSNRGLAFQPKSGWQERIAAEVLVYKRIRSDGPTRMFAVWWVLRACLLGACGILNYLWR